MEDQEGFFAGGEAIGGGGVVVAGDCEAAAFEDADGGDVGAGGAGMEGADVNLFEEEDEGLGGEAFAPVFFGDPVADEVLAFEFEAGDAADEVVAREDGFGDDGGLCEDGGPVGVEGGGVAWVDDGHAIGVGVELLLEEGGEVGGGDVAEGDAGRGIAGGHGGDGT